MTRRGSLSPLKLLIHAGLVALLVAVTCVLIERNRAGDPFARAQTPGPSSKDGPSPKEGPSSKKGPNTPAAFRALA